MADARFNTTIFDPHSTGSPTLIEWLRRHLTHKVDHRDTSASSRELDDLDEHLLSDVGIERKNTIVGWTPAAHGNDPTSIVTTSYQSRPGPF
ncbi:DUF1127 domain-containing protein [Neorhizobium sp. P12A]|jgi:uncharacterized protein YjiS (DUF1127 family)|uniref:DUF1127 domain-containing protein n=1 Tax=Neorhizobium sp. P12A TaxID=2268027 RepID=UPI0011EBC9EC|nr:DUF1127 domain-containing protein [Neorhizobium sp. P12A]